MFIYLSLSSLLSSSFPLLLLPFSCSTESKTRRNNLTKDHLYITEGTILLIKSYQQCCMHFCYIIKRHFCNKVDPLFWSCDCSHMTTDHVKYPGLTSCCHGVTVGLRGFPTDCWQYTNHLIAFNSSKHCS